MRTTDLSAPEHGERLARLEEWAEGHERRCEDRLKDIKGQFTEIKADLRKALYGACAVVLALLSWAAVQLYGNYQERLEKVEAVSAK